MTTSAAIRVLFLRADQERNDVDTPVLKRFYFLVGLHEHANAGYAPKGPKNHNFRPLKSGKLYKGILFLRVKAMHGHLRIKNV